MSHKVAVIGVGKMGSWFVNYFASRNFTVSVYDAKRTGLAFASSNVAVVNSLEKCVSDAELALICVPVRLTPEAVKECAKFMKESATLAEISSVKNKTFPALAKISNRVQPLCLHPMFGPGATVKNDLKVLLIPVRNEQRELEKAHKFFEGTRLIVIPSAKDHDDAIGIVLGLTYFCNLALADFISSENNKMLGKVAGTTFRLQSLIAESVMIDEPNLISVLISDNPSARKYTRQFLKKAVTIARLASKKNPALVEAKIKKVKDRMQQSNLQHSYNLLYAVMQAIDK